MRQCGCGEVLPKGTKVRVGNKIGTVTGVIDALAPQVPANVITFTHRVIHRSGCQSNRIEPLAKQQRSGINYSGIYIMEAA